AKTGGVDGKWDAQTESGETVSEGSYAQVTVADKSAYAMFGLGNSQQGASGVKAAFAIFMQAGEIAIYESGSLRGKFGNYNAGNTFAIHVQGGAVRYYKNNTLLYASTLRLPGYPLLLQTAISSKGGRIANAQICGGPVVNR